MSRGSTKIQSWNQKMVNAKKVTEDRNCDAIQLNLNWHYFFAERRRQWQPTPVFLPGKSHGWRSLVGSMGSRRVRHNWATSLSRIGEGNGRPLHCSCMDNPRNGGAWWSAVYGMAQSRTRLKRASSSSSSICWKLLFKDQTNAVQTDVERYF